LVILGALTAIGPLSIDMYLPAFTAIAADLGGDVGQVQMTLALYLAGLATGQLLYGPLSDRFGRKPPLYVGLLLYVAASLAIVVVDDLLRDREQVIVEGSGEPRGERLRDVRDRLAVAVGGRPISCDEQLAGGVERGSSGLHGGGARAMQVTYLLR